MTYISKSNVKLIHILGLIRVKLYIQVYYSFIKDKPYIRVEINIHDQDAKYWHAYFMETFQVLGPVVQN